MFKSFGAKWYRTRLKYCRLLHSSKIYLFYLLQTFSHNSLSFSYFFYFTTFEDILWKFSLLIWWRRKREKLPKIFFFNVRMKNKQKNLSLIYEKRFLCLSSHVSKESKKKKKAWGNLFFLLRNGKLRDIWMWS